MTEAATTPPLAIVSGAARTLGGAEPFTQRLQALCDYLQGALPAGAIRFRAGARSGDRASAGTSRARTISVEVPRLAGKSGLLEAAGSPRDPEEVRGILESIASLLATLLPLYDIDDDGDDGDLARLHRLTIDSLPVGLYVVDREYRVVLWNRKRETGTQGLRRVDVLGRRVLDVLRRQPPELLEAEFARVFSTGEVRVDEQEVHAGNDVRTYRTTRIPMRIDGESVSHVITIGEDVTETRAIQRAMHQSEKLAAVGQLAAGVMHEINNPLATIGGCTAAIAARLGDAAPAPVREYLAMIESEVGRCTTIIDGLLDFSRAGRGAPVSAPTDINAVLERTLDLLSHHQRFRRLHVSRDFADGLPLIAGNAERLVQAAMAILLNAADASAGHGNVTVRSALEGDMIVVEFADDGPGIPPDVLPKIFDPFFTTKGPSRGTGLGLAICYGIVADHHGHLDARNEPGVGTVFRMTLPRAGMEAT